MDKGPNILLQVSDVHLYNHEDPCDLSVSSPMTSLSPHATFSASACANPVGSGYILPNRP